MNEKVKSEETETQCENCLKLKARLVELEECLWVEYYNQACLCGATHDKAKEHADTRIAKG